ncbi:MAG: 4Fe-4S binding protein, partial [Eubacteriales bacterium]|nr:4Fe-4S binding protein [Eubacteriales bacterium]
MNTNLTEAIKKFAYENGADLVGISHMERFNNAPIKMSPQGVMPTAKSVIVCAIHHPDAAMQLGGEVHPQDHGPYRIQYVMNQKLDQISFRLGNFIESLGYDAVPIASSNIWRYRGYKDLTANFAPDMSHIYAAVSAGLSQVGWSGLSITPEYGSWNRFISIITDAELDETPLYTETKLCDMCGQCIRHCPTDAYRKECNGTRELVITDEVRYKMANKNLWRCAWGEHFNLDLDLKIPDVVTEEVLLEACEKYGSRDGEMGCCQKFCLPKQLRQDGGDYTTTFIRKRHVVPTDLPVHRRLYDEVVNAARFHGISDLVFLNETDMQKADPDVLAHFPHAKSAIVFALHLRKDLDTDTATLYQSHGDTKGPGNASDSLSDMMGRLTEFTELDICRLLEDKGFDALNFYGYREALKAAAGYAEAAGYPLPETEGNLPWGGFLLANGEYASYGVVLTSAAFNNAEYRGIDNPYV